VPTPRSRPRAWNSPEPEAHILGLLPDGVGNLLLQLNLAERRITSSLRASGFGHDFGWIKTGAFDAMGRPRRHDGGAEVEGLYFVSLSGFSCHGSAFIWGAWRDAQRLTALIAARWAVGTPEVALGWGRAIGFPAAPRISLSL
jgi:putative flavoprotein involved in K+ transport